MSRGSFSLSLAVCNSGQLRDYLVGRLVAETPSLRVVPIPPDTTDVFAVVRDRLAHQGPGSAGPVCIVDLHESLPSGLTTYPALRSLNASRELWGEHFTAPVIFWLPEYAATLLYQHAPDFWRWFSHQFEFVSERAEPALAAHEAFAGDTLLATRLSADQKRFRIAELEARISQLNTDPQPSMYGHARLWLNELAFLYLFVGDPQAAERTLQAALAMARAAGDRHDEGVTLGNLANAYADLGEARKAIACHEQSLATAREIRDRQSEGNALGNLGLAYADLGEPRKAIAYYEQALAIAREIHNRRAEGLTLGNLGNAYHALGEPRKAIEYNNQSLTTAREMGDRRGEGRALGNLGLAYAVLGEARKAIEHYEQALAIAREIGDRRGEGNALGNLGNVCAASGEPRKAIEYYGQLLTIDREIADRRDEANTCWNMGLAYEKAGDLARAADLLQVLVDYEREIAHPDAEKHAAEVAALRARLK